MRLWLGEPCPAVEDVDEDVVWGEGKVDFDRLIADFKDVRTDQIALLPKFDESTWNMPHKTIWGRVTLLWVVSKTFQHTAEHTSDVMRLALFWDKQEAYNRAKSAG